MVPWKILKDSVNNCLSVSDKFVSLTIAMLSNKLLSHDTIIGGECSSPGIISLIGCCNDNQIKKNLELNESSNVLLFGCEGDTDKMLYDQLLQKGKRELGLNTYE